MDRGGFYHTEGASAKGTHPTAVSYELYEKYEYELWREAFMIK